MLTAKTSHRLCQLKRAAFVLLAASQPLRPPFCPAHLRVLPEFLVCTSAQANRSRSSYSSVSVRACAPPPVVVSAHHFVHPSTAHICIHPRSLHTYTHTHPHTGNKSSQHWGSTHFGLGLLVDYRAYSSHHCPSTNGPHCHPDQRVCVCVCLCVPEIHTHEAIDCVLKLPGNSKVMPGLPFIVDPPICYAIYSCVSSTPCM